MRDPHNRKDIRYAVVFDWGVWLVCDRIRTPVMTNKANEQACNFWRMKEYDQFVVLETRS